MDNRDPPAAVGAAWPRRKLADETSGCRARGLSTGPVPVNQQSVWPGRCLVVAGQGPQDDSLRVLSVDLDRDQRNARAGKGQWTQRESSPVAADYPNGL